MNASAPPSDPTTVTPRHRRHRPQLAFWLSTATAVALLALGFKVSSADAPVGKTGAVDLNLFSDTGGSVGFSPTDTVTWMGAYTRPDMSSTATYQIDIHPRGATNGTASAMPVTLSAATAQFPSPLIASPAWQATFQNEASTWVDRQPVSGDKVRTLRYTYKPSLIPPLFQAADFAGTGDGYHPMSYITNVRGKTEAMVLVVNHHTDNRPIQCRLRSDVTRACPGFPQTASGVPTGGLYINVKAGADLTTGGDLVTPSSMLFSHLDSVTGRLYIPTISKINVPEAGVRANDIGVACVDFSRLPYTSCGFKPLANTYLGGSLDTSIVGAATVGPKVYLSEPTGRLLCYDSSSNTDCSLDNKGQPLYLPLDRSMRINPTTPLIYTTNYSSFSDSGYIFAFGNYFGSRANYLTCFNTNTNQVCDGSWPKKLNADGVNQMMTPANLFPIPKSTPNAAGGYDLAGVCGRGRPREDSIGNNVGNNAIIDPSTPSGRAASPFFICYNLDGSDLAVPRALYNYAAEAGTSASTVTTADGSKPRWFWTGTANPWVNVFSSSRFGSKVLGVTQVWDRNVIDKVPTTGDVASYVGTAIKDAIWCVDMATGAACNEPGNQYPVFATQGRSYVIREDNTKAGCFWLLGDYAKGYPFEAETGEICGQKTVEFRVNTKPLDYYGYDPTVENPIVYNKVVLGNLVWGKDIANTAEGVKVIFRDKNTDKVISTVYFPQGSNSMTVPAAITFEKYPNLETSILVSRPRPNPPIFNESAQVDLVWTGPPLQLGLRGALSNSAMCLLDGTIQSTVTAPDGSSQTGDTTLSNALIRGVTGNNDALQPIITNRFALKASYGSGATATDLPMSLVLRPRYDQANYTGDLLLRGLVTYNAAHPDSANERNVGAGALTAASTATAAVRNVQTLNAAGKTVAFKRATLDTSVVDALNRSRTGLIDNRADQRIDYLRGKRSDEVGYVSASGVKGTLFRRRVNIDASASSTDLPPKIGPVINGGLALLDPQANSFYSGAAKGYLDYVRATGRTLPVALVASNDGMVHGYRINGSVGNASSINLRETFAYIPRGLTPRLPGLSERNATQLMVNSYYLDSTPTVGDVDLSNGAGSNWRSVAVLPFGRSVKGVMALDVTRSDAESPNVGLWEFTDKSPALPGESDPEQTMGYITAQSGVSPNNPSVSSQIARIRVGGTVRSAYVFGNGYDSASGSATLFVAYMDGAVNGQPEYKSVTVTNSGGNGLSTPLLVSGTNGELQYALAGDLKGNLWRFDFTTPGAIKSEVLFKAAQPIVSAPALVNTTEGPVLVVATGKPQPNQLRIESAASTGTYAIYGLRLNGLLGKPSGSSLLGGLITTILSGKVNTVTPALSVGTMTSSVVDGRTTRTVTFSGPISAAGWMLNLPAGEMVLGNVFAHPTNNQVTITALSSASAGAVCSAGESIQYRINPMLGTGKGISNSPSPSNNTQRITRAAPPNAQGQIAVGGTTGSKDPNTNKANPTQTLDKAYYSGRLMWRELSN